MIIEGGELGPISIWLSQGVLEDNSGDIRQLHVGNISGICLSDFQDEILTLGAEDCSIIDWRGRILLLISICGGI